MYKSLKYYIPAIVWSAVLYLLSSDAPVEMTPFDWLSLFRLDLLAHVFVYGLLGMLIYWGIVKASNLGKKQVIICSILLASVYGILMEILQQYHWERRSFDYLDMIANTIGAAIGAYFISKYVKK